MRNDGRQPALRSDVNQDESTSVDRRRRSLLRAIAGSASAVTLPFLSRSASADSRSASRADGQEDGDVELVSADPDGGFNYPYYLYMPGSLAEEPRPLLVEPNNTGGAIDDFSVHKEVARLLIQEHWPRHLSDELGTPLLVPVFPRPTSDPVDVTHYVHALDTETMHVDSGDLARVDRQLRRMVDDARERLADAGAPVTDRIIMDGYSATGNFVNRFTALHPDLVTSVTAGGINGTAILPLEEAKGHMLNYQIGVADLDEFVDGGFDRERWTEVDQYVYMGAEDENDTIPPEDTDVPPEQWDAWGPDQREVALAVYGDDMQEDRMPYCESIYEETGASATFHIYDGVGHEVTEGIRSDLVEFHRSHMDDLQFEEGDESASDDEGADGSGNGSDDAGAGFGIAGGLVGLGTAYLWRRVRTTED